MTESGRLTAWGDPGGAAGIGLTKPYDTISGRFLPEIVSQARAAPERSRNPHCEAINRISYDGEPASVGNGVMVALAARDREQVDRLHRLALDLGGSDEGQPGPRGGFYAAYFRDPDGNKLNAFVMLGEGA